MKKALKELLENAKPYNGETLTSILIIPSGKAYTGFWGRNGYNRLIVIGQNEENDYLVSTEYQQDVINCFTKTGFSVDVSSKYNCVCIFGLNYFTIDNSLSNLKINIMENIKNE